MQVMAGVLNELGAVSPLTMYGLLCQETTKQTKRLKKS